MSIEASVEVAQTPEEIAGVIDRDLFTVALYMPQAVKYAASGETTTLYEEPGLGVLSATYMGSHVVRVTARGEDANGQLGFYQDYELDYWQHTHVINPIEVSDFDGCSQDFLQDLMRVIHGLRENYVNDLSCRVMTEWSKDQPTSTLE
jgi:hypothetical protein